MEEGGRDFKGGEGKRWREEGEREKEVAGLMNLFAINFIGMN